MIRHFVIHKATGEIITNRKRLPPDPRPDRKMGARGRIPWPGGVFDSVNFEIVAKDVDGSRDGFDSVRRRYNVSTGRFVNATESQVRELETDRDATLAEERLEGHPNRRLAMKEAWESWKARTGRDVSFRRWLRVKLRGGEPV